MAIYNNDIDPNEIMWEKQNNIENKVMDVEKNVESELLNSLLSMDSQM